MVRLGSRSHHAMSLYWWWENGSLSHGAASEEGRLHMSACDSHNSVIETGDHVLLCVFHLWNSDETY